MTYLPRVLDSMLAGRLQRAGAVVIEGPKACGKTATASKVASSQARLDVDEEVRRAAQVDPSLILPGERPRLLDEWQLFPRLWDHVRRAVDDADGPGQFILAGSATPNEDARRHSGAGRFATLHLRPMSLFEMGRSSVEVSLAALFEAEPARARNGSLGLEEALALLVRGGWPKQVTNPRPEFCIDYLEQIVQVDVPSIGPRRDPDRLRATLASLARNTATAAGDKTISDDVGVARSTVAAYLDTLRRLLIVEDLPGFNTHLRSSRNLRSRPKRHFVDPSLATAALETEASALMDDLRFAGLLFESMAIRDLRVLAAPLGGRVAYFETDTHEIDVIVHLRDGRWGGVEVKLGGEELIDEGAEGLRASAAAIAGEPSFLAVVTAFGSYAYRREDGVDVIPLATLAP